MILGFFYGRTDELLGDLPAAQVGNNIMPSQCKAPAYISYKAANPSEINTLEPYRIYILAVIDFWMDLIASL